MGATKTEDEYVKIPKKEYESMKATIETIEDDYVMDQIRRSKDASSKSLEKVKKKLGIQ